MYTIRYLVSLGLVVISCSAGYTMVVMWGITKVFPLTGSVYWVVSGVLFFVISSVALRFYIPRLRNVW